MEAGSPRGASDLANVDTGAVLPTLTTTVPNGTYFIRVRGKNECRTGPASNDVVITVSGQ